MQQDDVVSTLKDLIEICKDGEEGFKACVDPKQRLFVSTAKKGVGKSALLQWASYIIGKTDADSIVIKCRGADLARNKF